MSKHKAIIVLSDGETWETLAGQSICILTEEDYHDLAEGRRDACDLIPVVEIGLQDFTPYNNDFSGENNK